MRTAATAFLIFTWTMNAAHALPILWEVDELSAIATAGAFLFAVASTPAFVRRVLK